MTLLAPPSADPAASAATDYARAMLNILGDLTEDKDQMHEMQAAVLNLLEDAGEEKARFGATQAAMLNILEDFDDEKRQRAQAEAQVRQLNAQLEQRVRERKAQLESSNKDLEGFSYSVSHDLRAPLRAIDAFSGMLLEQYSDRLDAEGRRLLQTVRANAGKMAKLIDDILAFSRSGRRELELTMVDMDSLVQHTLAQVVPAGRDVELKLGALPRPVADRAMLQQVLANLLSNAVKFTGQRERALIEVGGVAHRDELIYSIRDNGAGFDPAYAHKLFDVFQRLHGADQFPGTGIGLAIVKRIILKHGGRVWAEGAIDRGATFYFSLPQRELPEPANGVTA